MWKPRSVGYGAYHDRKEAGRVLADQLDAYRGKDVLVLGIPRGGVPVAAEVARSLGAELDVIVARKLGAPGSPELAIGAVTADGGRYLNDEMVGYLGVADDFIDEETREQMAEAKRREERFRGNRPLRVAGRTVILVDDGLATGATMRASVRSLKGRNAARVVVAVPVGATESCVSLRREVDELVCPFVPEYFGAVGNFYEHFEATEDDEVKAILEEFRARRPSEVRAAS